MRDCWQEAWQACCFWEFSQCNAKSKILAGIDATQKIWNNFYDHQNQILHLSRCRRLSLAWRGNSGLSAM